MTLQNDAGTVADADSYISVTEFKAHHDARGNDYSTLSDENIATAIVRATDYLDARFGFDGRKCEGRSQTTEWPRNGVSDADGYSVEGIPREIKDATAEYALRALTAALNPDPERDSTGRMIASKSVTVGPITESATYQGSVSSVPKYPAVDNMLKATGFVHGVSGSQVRMVRG